MDAFYKKWKLAIKVSILFTFENNSSYVTHEGAIL